MSKPLWCLYNRTFSYSTTFYYNTIFYNNTFTYNSMLFYITKCVTTKNTSRTLLVLHLYTFIV